MTDREIFHEDFKPRPYWWEAAPPTSAGSRPPPERADVVVVGSGFAGLNAALELARRGVSVAVLEAEQFGYGASTRNGGHVSSGSNLGKAPSAAQKSPIVRLLGEERYRQLLDEAAQSFDHLETIINREGIDCHWVRSGRFVGALTREHYRSIEKKAEGAAGVSLVPRDRQHEEIASDFYHGGMVIERSGQLHPALYHRGLLKACVQQGVHMSAECPALSVTRRNGGFVIGTPKGEISAESVFFGTNGYTGEVTPWLRRRVIPLGSYIIATEELPEDLAGSLIPRRRTINDTKRILSYFRMSPDGRRLLFGGRESFSATDERRSARLLNRTMLRVFPQLEGVRISHSWTGNVAFSFDFLPHLGCHEGIHYAAACNGSGVAMMSYLGYRAALRIAGTNDVSAFEGLRFPSRWYYYGTPWFMPLVGRYYRARDYFDRKLEREGSRL